MDKMKIRQVLMKDLDKVVQIESTCFPKEEAAQKSAFKERIAVFPKGFFIAELNNEIIGFINSGATNESNIKDEFFKTMDAHIPKGENLAIFGLDILPKYQSKGYAKDLMNYFIKTAKEDGRKKVLLTCKENLIKYYQQFGYINEGLSDSEHGDAKWYDLYINL